MTICDASLPTRHHADPDSNGLLADLQERLASLTPNQARHGMHCASVVEADLLYDAWELVEQRPRSILRVV